MPGLCRHRAYKWWPETHSKNFSLFLLLTHFTSPPSHTHFQTPFFSSEKGSPWSPFPAPSLFHGYQPILAYQVTAGLSTCAHARPLRPNKSAQLGERELKAGNGVIHSASPTKNAHEDRAAHLLCKCRGLGPTQVCSLVGCSVSVSPGGPRLVDSVGLLVVSP